MAEAHAAQAVAASGRLHVSVLTPKGPIMKQAADEVTAPGILGEFGVLAGHIPFLTVLKPGVLIVRDGQRRDVMAVGAGFVEVGADSQVRVLVDQLERPADIDIAAAREDLAKNDAELKSGTATPAAAALAQARLAWAQARVDAHSVK